MKTTMREMLVAALATTALVALPAFAQDNQNAGQSGGQGSGTSGADIQVQQPAPEVTVQQPAPDVTVSQPQPQVTIEQPQPTVTVDQPEPNVTVEQQGQPNVTVEEQGQPNVQVEQSGQAQSDEPTQPQTMGQDQQQGMSPGQQAGSASTAGGTMPENALHGMRGNEIVGQNVYGANGEEIGEVDNVVIQRGSNGTPAVLVGVGGFLGIGERDVAISLDQLSMEQDRLVTDMTRDQIAAMEAYDENNWDSWDANRPMNEAVTR